MKKRGLVLFSTFLMMAGEAAFADRTAQETPSNETAAEIQLPVCLKSHDAEIQTWLKANKDSKTQKYKAYKDIYSGAGVDEPEILARLIYAESEAANCESIKLTEYIGGAIYNRIRNKGKSISDIVFQFDQFASSLNGYSKANRAGFLCPTDLERWRMSQATVKHLLADAKSNVLPCEAASYYLYKNNPWTHENPKGFKIPDWAKAKGIKTAIDSECVRFFPDDRFKCGS